jgi:hypothetical protein
MIVMKLKWIIGGILASVFAHFVISMIVDYDPEAMPVWCAWWFIFILFAAIQTRQKPDRRKKHPEVATKAKHKPKRKQKPEYIRTADGDLLEVVDAPETNSLEHRA